jgi:ADP-heptose:LPS heptosyltransferase
MWCAVHIGPTTWAAKNWPVDRWIEIIDWLRQNQWKVLLLGDNMDRRINHDLDLRQQKGIQELAAHLKVCSLFVGLDSFPAHAAAALEVPAVVLYGITNPACFAVHTAPYVAVRSDPKHPNTGRRNKIANITYLQAKDDVMRTISVEQVKTAILSLCPKPVSS